VATCAIPRERLHFPHLRAGYFSTPTTASENLRTGIQVCDSNRLCTMGRMMPPVDFGLSCPNGTATASVVEDVWNTDFGPGFVVTTPGCAGCALTYVITSVVPWTAGCPANTSLVTFNTATNKLRVGAKALRLTRCTEGYNITFVSGEGEGGGGRMLVSLPRSFCCLRFTLRWCSPAQEARRSTATTLLASCTVVTALDDVNEPPKITAGACANRSVAERSAVCTAVGSPLTASDP
jgi:hypothetical protein